MRRGLFACALFSLTRATPAGEDSFLRDLRALLKGRAYDEAARLADGRSEAHARDARLLKGYLGRALANAERAKGTRVRVCGIGGTLLRVKEEEITIRTRGMELTQPFGRLRSDEVVAFAEIDPPRERFAMRALFYYAEGDEARARKEVRGARGGAVAERVRQLLSRAPEARASPPRGKPAPAARKKPSGAFENRAPEKRRECVQAYGGSDASERAVEAALAWLANHQEPDGRWDGEKYEGDNVDPGISGLAVLAFLGAGYAQLDGRYKTTVANAIDWIVSQQDAQGCIGKGFSSGVGYHHAICALALAENYGMTRDERVGRAAQKAVDYSVNVHQCPGSGWRYSPKQPADTSVTGWFVMQLKSARDAGLRVPSSGFAGASSFIEKVTTDGRTSYKPGSLPSVTMTAAGMVCRQAMGCGPTDATLRLGADWLLTKLPRWNRANFYYWYYETLAMFQMGGKLWDSWNEAMRDALVPHQRRGGDEGGSWDPVGSGGVRRGGRVMSTAVGALCLEVYYRYPRAWE